MGVRPISEATPHVDLVVEAGLGIPRHWGLLKSGDAFLRK